MAPGALLMVFAGLATAAPASPSAPGSGPLIGGRVGHWNLRDLEARPPLRLEPGRAEARVPFRLPAGSRQGKPLWYLTRLQAAVQFAQRVSGKFLLTADVNGATVAQIPLVVTARSIRVEELGLVEGRRSRTVFGRQAKVDFRNYVQISGIRPGANVLRFAIEPVAVRGLSRPGAFAVAVLGGSGMEATRVLPDELLLSAEPAAVTAPVGQEVRVGYWLRRRGGRLDAPTTVRLGGGGLDITGADAQRLTRVGAGVHGAFTVVGREPATYMVMIAVPDRYNEPSAPVTVTITAPASGTAGAGPGPARFGGAGVLVLAGLALLVGSRRRDRNRRPVIPARTAAEPAAAEPPGPGRTP